MIAMVVGQYRDAAGSVVDSQLQGFHIAVCVEFLCMLFPPPTNMQLCGLAKKKCLQVLIGSRSIMTLKDTHSEKKIGCAWKHIQYIISLRSEQRSKKNAFCATCTVQIIQRLKIMLQNIRLKWKSVCEAKLQQVTLAFLSIFELPCQALATDMFSSCLFYGLHDVNILFSK